MRRLLAALALVLFTQAGAFAGGKPTPPTAEQQAAKVLAAFTASDAKSLHELATVDEPDPWCVVDALIGEGAPAAAAAFAAAAPRPDVARLGAFIDSRRDRPEDSAARAALLRAEAALKDGQWQAALDAAEGPAAESDGLVSLRRLRVRGSALFSLARYEEAAKAFGETSDGARAIGWLAAEAWGFRQQGYCFDARADARGALKRWTERLRLEERRGHDAAIAEALRLTAGAKRDLGEFDEARPLFVRSVALYHQVGDALGEGQTLQGLGVLYARRGQFAEAIDAEEKALAILEPLDDKAGIAAALGCLGNVRRSQGDYAQALVAFRRAADLQEALGNSVGLAGELGNLAWVHLALGNQAEAQSLLARAIPVAEKAGTSYVLASLLSAQGTAYRVVGELAKSLEVQQRAIAIIEKLGDRRGHAVLLGNLGNLLWDMGDRSAAIVALDRGLLLHRSMGNQAGAAKILASLGSYRLALGDLEEARDLFSQALKIQEALGMKSGVVESTLGIATTLGLLGDTATAFPYFERALAAAVAIGEKPTAMRILGGMGFAHWKSGDFSKARDEQARALALAEALGDKDSEERLLVNLALVEAKLGETEKALSRLARSSASAERRGARGDVVQAAWIEGLVRLDSGDLSGALAAADRAVRTLPGVLRGFADIEGATARDLYSEVYDVGALAAIGLHDVDAFARFLEGGRAAGILEALGGREAVQLFLVPEGLRMALHRARVSESAALAKYRSALDSGDGSQSAAGRSALDAARAEVDRAAASIEREARAAQVLSREPSRLESVRARLLEGEALVMFGITDKAIGGRCLALVVTRAGARGLDLGARDPVDVACEALGPEGRSEGHPDAVAELRRIVLAPLALGADITRLFVSPDGPLSLVPFCLLDPAREIVYVASGTLLDQLRSSAPARGRRILALGDPVYSGPAAESGATPRAATDPALTPLPHSRAEAQSVGDVVLLGANASVPKLREALKRSPRWHAIHFACHGLVDFDRPTHSALALSRSDEDDGRLQAGEVARLSIPADLVTVSACESGRGKLIRAEGILGFTRAFMLAGASRVLVSLWKADDKATRLLMEKFYDLWNRQHMGAGAALKKAQEFVQQHEEEAVDPAASRAAGHDVTARMKPYAAPQFWAGWELWGLPE